MQEGGGGDTAAAGHQAIYPPFFEEDETTVFPVGSVGEGVGARREEAAGSPHTPPIGRTESDQENSLNPQCGEASAGSAPGAFSVVVHHGSVHEQGVGSHVDPWFPAGRPDSPDAYNPKDSGGCHAQPHDATVYCEIWSDGVFNVSFYHRFNRMFHRGKFTSSERDRNNYCGFQLSVHCHQPIPPECPAARAGRFGFG